MAGVVNCGGSFMVVVKGVLLLLQVCGCGGSCMVVVKGVWLLRKFVWLLWHLFRIFVGILPPLPRYYWLLRKF